MSSVNLEIFKLVADGIQIFLCVCIVFLLLRRRKRADSNETSSWPSGEARHFRQEFWLQSIKHQSAQAFDNLQQALQSERRKFSRCFEIGQDQWLPNADAEGDADFSPRLPEAVRDTEPIEAGTGSRERYHRVALLASEGLDARRISKRLDIPMEEVELVLKLSGPANGGTPVVPEASIGPFSDSAVPTERRKIDR